MGILQKRLVQFFSCPFPMSQNIDESLGPGDIFWVLERNMKKC